MVTKQRAFKESEAWVKGDGGQRLVAHRLQKRGWFIVPGYDFSDSDNNKAPRLCGLFRGYVLPDLDACKMGRRRWVEVKTKDAPTLHRKTGVLEHGFALRHFEDYQEVEQISGTEVWVVVYETVSGEILYARLRALIGQARIYRGDKMDRGGTVFFPKSSFVLLEKIRP